MSVTVEASGIRDTLEHARIDLKRSALPDELKDVLFKLLDPAVEKLNLWILATHGETHVL